MPEFIFSYNCGSSSYIINTKYGVEYGKRNLPLSIEIEYENARYTNGDTISNDIYATVSPIVELDIGNVLGMHQFSSKDKKESIDVTKELVSNKDTLPISFKEQDDICMNLPEPQGLNIKSLDKDLASKSDKNSDINSEALIEIDGKGKKEIHLLPDIDCGRNSRKPVGIPGSDLVILLPMNYKTHAIHHNIDDIKPSSSVLRHFIFTCCTSDTHILDRDINRDANVDTLDIELYNKIKEYKSLVISTSSTADNLINEGAKLNDMMSVEGKRSGDSLLINDTEFLDKESIDALFTNNDIYTTVLNRYGLMFSFLKELTKPEKSVTISEIIEAQPIKELLSIGEEYIEYAWKKAKDAYQNVEENTFNRVGNRVAEIIITEVATLLDRVTEELLFKIKNENLVDNIDLPSTDFNYTKAELMAIDEYGNVIGPASSAIGSRVRVNMPNKHYSLQYADIGLLKVPVKLQYLKDVLLILFAFKNDYKRRLTGTEPRTAVNFILDELNTALTVLKDGAGNTLDNEYDRAFRLVRWYGESSVMRNSDYLLIRDYTDYIAPFYLDDIDKVDYINYNSGFTVSDGFLTNISANSAISFSFETFVEQELLIIYKTVTTSIDQNTNNALIAVDGEEDVLPFNSIQEKIVTLQPGLHEIGINSQDSALYISNIKIGGIIEVQEPTVEYIPGTGDGLKTIIEMNEMLLNYLVIHHDNKVKGLRSSLKKY